jgi:hypothetical protein
MAVWTPVFSKVFLHLVAAKRAHNKAWESNADNVGGEFGLHFRRAST